MADLVPTEIMALARILDELNYYQVLHLDPTVSAGEIRSAFHQSSRAFRPDANRHLSPEMRAALGKIAKRITEAYTVLRDPGRRKAYDESLAKGKTRMQVAEADARAEQRATEELHGATPTGRRYSTLAQADLGRGDLKSALRNLKTALTFEPTNVHFQKKVAEIKQKLR